MSLRLRMVGSDEDDYMSFVVEETSNAKESSLQRRQRKQRESEIKSIAKTKAEREEDEKAKREEALSTALDSSNKGFKMMAKLGYKGGALGKSNDAREQPVQISIKDDRGGIGMDTEKKRKFREAVEQESKRVKTEQTDYREQIRLEREEKRHTAQFYGAQKTLEQLEDEKEQGGEKSHADGSPNEGKKSHKMGQKPLKSINVVYRGLVRHRFEQERDRKIRHGLNSSLPRLPNYVDEDEEDQDYQTALGQDTEIVDDGLDDEDTELEEFEALPIAVRLQKVVLYLRENHHYCFWCKYKYPDVTMEGCPGITEEDHD